MFINTKDILVGRMNIEDAFENTRTERAKGKGAASYSTGTPIVLAKCGRKYLVVDGHHRITDYLLKSTMDAPTFEFGEMNEFQKSLIHFHGIKGATLPLAKFVKDYKKDWTRIFGLGW